MVLVARRASGAGGGLYVAGGTLSLVNATLDGNQAVGGQGGVGGRGGTGGFGRLCVRAFPSVRKPEMAVRAAVEDRATAVESMWLVERSILSADTLNGNIAQGGQGGTGGAGGSGPLAVVFGGSGNYHGLGVERVERVRSSRNGGGGGTAINSAGKGGDGGNGGEGDGGGLYVSSGTLTLTNATIADNSAEAGASGSSGKGGKAGTGKLTGGPGNAGEPW